MKNRDRVEGLAHMNLAKAFTDASHDMHLPAKAAIAFVNVERADPETLPAEIRNTAERRRNTFAAGRQAAKAALQMAGYSGQTDIAIGADKLPVWPQGWTGSISHTDDIAAAIVIPTDRDITILPGIDIERIVSMKIASEIVSEVAPELLSAESHLPFGEQITRAFSAKEALYKALFPKCREFKNFSAARVSWYDTHGTACPGICLTLTETWHADYPAGFSLNAKQMIVGNHIVSIIWDQR